jgi:hypothetical protein
MQGTCSRALPQSQPSADKTIHSTIIALPFLAIPLVPCSLPQLFAATSCPLFSWLNSPYISPSLLSVQDAGINHKEFGVTSEGVVVYLDVALRSVLKINPNK